MLIKKINVNEFFAIILYSGILFLVCFFSKNYMKNVWSHLHWTGLYSGFLFLVCFFCGNLSYKSIWNSFLILKWYHRTNVLLWRSGITEMQWSYWITPNSHTTQSENLSIFPLRSIYLKSTKRNSKIQTTMFFYPRG